MSFYNDRLDPTTQVDVEEEIASTIFDEIDGIVTEEDCAELGRKILLLVLSEFRPDLLDNNPQSSGRHNKQPFYHHLEILFTATEDLSDVTRTAEFRDKLAVLLSKSLASVLPNSVEVDGCDAEPGDPSDLV